MDRRSVLRALLYSLGAALLPQETLNVLHVEPSMDAIEYLNSLESQVLQFAYNPLDFYDDDLTLLMISEEIRVPYTIISDGLTIKTIRRDGSFMEVSRNNLEEEIYTILGRDPEGLHVFAPPAQVSYNHNRKLDVAETRILVDDAAELKKFGIYLHPGMSQPVPAMIQDILPYDAVIASINPYLRRA